MSRLRAIWRLLNMPCEGMSRLTSESFDRDLGRLERLALRSHLIYCAACRRYRRQLELLRCAMRRLARDAESGDAPDARADFLDGDHQGKREKHAPKKIEPVSRASL